MGAGASQETESTSEYNKNRKTDPPKTDIDFNSEIRSKAVSSALRASRVSEVEPPKPDISKMDDEEAYQTVRSELDQALSGHYSFVLSSQPAQPGQPPSLHNLEKLLQEKGYKNPDLGDAKQRQVIKSVLLDKKYAGDQHGTRPPIRKGSLSKLEALPSGMPPLSPVNIKKSGWARPQSLVEEEEELKKKFNTKKDDKNGDKGEMDGETLRKRQHFDANKFAAANVSPLQKELEIYTVATYKKYEKKKPDEKEQNVDTESRLRLPVKDSAIEYNPSEEALLDSIENEFT